jgi:hypothetical protein
VLLASATRSELQRDLGSATITPLAFRPAPVTISACSRDAYVQKAVLAPLLG